jgi:hypothetical protein
VTSVGTRERSPPCGTSPQPCRARHRSACSSASRSPHPIGPLLGLASAALFYGGSAHLSALTLIAAAAGSPGCATCSRTSRPPCWRPDLVTAARALVVPTPTHMALLAAGLVAWRWRNLAAPIPTAPVVMLLFVALI